MPPTHSPRGGLEAFGPEGAYSPSLAAAYSGVVTYLTLIDYRAMSQVVKEPVLPRAWPEQWAALFPSLVVN